MNVPELYATNRLSTEDEEAFEIHLLECPECRDQVAWADDFGISMRSVAVEEATRAAAHAGFLVWLARRGPALRMALTAALLVLAALPAWLLVERSSLQAELAKSQAAAARPVLPAPQASPLPQGPDPAMPGMQAELDQLKQERSRLAAELGREREAREALHNQVAELTQPQGNAHIVSMGTVRGATDAQEIEIGPDPEFLVLSLELPAAEYEIYRASLFDARGHRIWQGNGLVPDASAMLNVHVHSSFLKPGEYQMKLEGIDQGRAVPALDLPFRVRRD
jgi:hypothetical protein